LAYSEKVIYSKEALKHLYEDMATHEQ